VQAFIRLLIYVLLLFLLMGVIATFLGALINYSRRDAWRFDWADIVDLFPGIFAYALAGCAPSRSAWVSSNDGTTVDSPVYSLCSRVPRTSSCYLF
jgi:hypothetical protein